MGIYKESPVELYKDSRFNIFSFLLITLISYLVMTVFPFAELRAILVYILLPIFFYMTFVKKVNIDVFSLHLLFTFFLMICYKLLQYLFIEDPIDLMVYEISFLVIFIMLTFYALSDLAVVKIRNTYAKSLAFFIIYLLFFVSYQDWSLTRISGIFSNPNITAHTAVMVFPFAMLFLKKKSMLLLYFILLALLLATASRSSLLAVLCMSIAFIACKTRPFNNSCLIMLAVLCSLTLFSWHAADLISESAELVSKALDSHSRVFYTDDNGRDNLKEIAWQRFNNSPYFGVGSQLSKIKIGDEDFSVHNGYIELLLRYGLLGIIFLVTLFLQLFTAIMKQSNFYKTVSFVSLTGLLSLGTSSSIFFVLNYYFIWSFILILYCYRTSKHEQNDIAA